MTSNVDHIIAKELLPGERLIWSGQPKKGVRFATVDVFLIPFSLLWCGFAVFWTVSASKGGGGPVFTAWGLMFVAFGLHFVGGRFIADAIRRAHTLYALTSQRTIIVSGVFARQVKSIDLKGLLHVALTENADGSGTIQLDRPTGPYAWSASFLNPSWPGAARYMPPSFEMISDARHVYSMIRKARDEVGTA